MSSIKLLYIAAESIAVYTHQNCATCLSPDLCLQAVHEEGSYTLVASRSGWHIVACSNVIGANYDSSLAVLDVISATCALLRIGLLISL